MGMLLVVLVQLMLLIFIIPGMLVLVLLSLELLIHIL
jgi:hypothetical protein